MLSPAQEAIFLGLSLNSATLTAHFSMEQMKSFRACQALFRLGGTVQFSSATWADGVGHPCDPSVPHNRAPVLHCFLQAMARRECWSCLSAPGQCAAGESHSDTRSVYRHCSVQTEASMMGWDVVNKGQTARGGWGINLWRSHIKNLELSVVFLPLKYFLPSWRVITSW